MEGMKGKKQEKSAGLGGQIATPVKYDPQQPNGAQIPKNALKDAEKVKTELEQFQKKILKLFPYIHSLSILPAQSFKFFEEDEGLLKEEIDRKPLHLIMLIPEDNFKDIPKKIKPEVIRLIQEGNHNIWIHIKTEVDLWSYGLDSKYEFLDAIGSSYPLYDKGLLGSLRVASIHKNLVLRKFEKYVASYIIFGSLVRGVADKDSDVDTFIIIDDTDVKRMPRLQLLEKLRGIIYDYVREASALAGVKNILNVQVSLLTDFWDRVKDAEPVAFTMIRDGVPMYDKGTFLPWKLLLQMGKIKPSPEAVDKFMKYGEQTESIFQRRMLDAMVEIYWGVVTPIQALMMLAGQPLPEPKRIVEDVKKVFVEQEKIMDIKELKTLEKAVKYYKDYEHGKLKSISGKELDEFFNEAMLYDKKMKEMRIKLEAKLIEHSADDMDNEVFTLLTNIFGKKGRNAQIKDFETELIKKGKMKSRFLPILQEISKIKQKVKQKKVSQIEMDNLKRGATEFVNELIDYTQRKELITTEKGILPIMFGDQKDKKGELVLTGTDAFFVESGRILKINTDKFDLSTKEEFEKALSETKDEVTFSINSQILNVLKKELGDFDLGI